MSLYYYRSNITTVGGVIMFGIGNVFSGSSGNSAIKINKLEGKSAAESIQKDYDSIDKTLEENLTPEQKTDLSQFHSDLKKYQQMQKSLENNSSNTFEGKIAEEQNRDALRTQLENNLNKYNNSKFYNNQDKAMHLNYDPDKNTGSVSLKYSKDTPESLKSKGMPKIQYTITKNFGDLENSAIELKAGDPGRSLDRPSMEIGINKTSKTILDKDNSWISESQKLMVPERRSIENSFSRKIVPDSNGNTYFQENSSYSNILDKLKPASKDFANTVIGETGIGGFNVTEKSLQNTTVSDITN